MVHKKIDSSKQRQNSRIRLYDILKTSYDSPEKQQHEFGKRNYIRDNDLSNDNHQLYHKPKKFNMAFS